MLKQKLRRGERCIGTWLIGGAAGSAEVLARAGLDFVVIDHDDDPAARLRAIAGTCCAGIVRLPGTDATAISRALEAGAAGILAENVATAESARRVADACGSETLIALEVAGRTAIEHVAEIADLDGVDVIFLRDPTAAHIARTVQARGRPLGTCAANGETAAALFERGYAMVAAGSDLSLLGRGAGSLLATARAGSPQRPPAVYPIASAALAGIPGNPDTSIRRMRQFWIAWCVAVLVLGAAVVGVGTLFAVSEAWPTSAKIGGRVAAGLLAALAIYDAYRIAARGTAALQDVLAQNLAGMVVAELERLQVAAAHRKLALATRDDPKLAAALPGPTAFDMPLVTIDKDDVRNLLGNPTEAALRDVLNAIEAYNRLVDRHAPGDDLPEASLLPQIEEISVGINRALASVLARLEAPGRGA